jgi:hypothetical protein
MIKCVLDVGDAVILSLDGKDPLECTHQELLIAHDLLKSRWSCKRILKVTSIVAQSATIMEQNAQNNEHRRRLSFFGKWAPMSLSSRRMLPRIERKLLRHTRHCPVLIFAAQTLYPQKTGVGCCKYFRSLYSLKDEAAQDPCEPRVKRMHTQQRVSTFVHYSG